MEMAAKILLLAFVVGAAFAWPGQWDSTVQQHIDAVKATLKEGQDAVHAASQQATAAEKAAAAARKCDGYSPLLDLLRSRVARAQATRADAEVLLEQASTKLWACVRPSHGDDVDLNCLAYAAPDVRSQALDTAAVAKRLARRVVAAAQNVVAQCA
ncbi:hypothetical protein ONE63_003392 [Megalurothrips usitatus]|uniref:Uncharacterized protein n=1 Tax=Megalurothrips usitatus TaxID=439358 RepID=A0AAV7XB65_9NEOP|nr:hypothetical protein ONE63_003392 [Megalurothrips usitatus]